MDYTLEKKSVPVRETVFDGCLEQPVDLDFTLPDYCPGIEKILKCSVTPKIHSKDLSGDRLTIDGVATICVLYIDEEKKTLRSCEHSVPYSGSITVKPDCSDAVIRTYAKPEYVNCRAISPRRLDIHGAFSLCAKIETIFNRETAVDCSADDIQLKKNRAACSRLCALSQQQFSVMEELEPISGSPAVRTIIKSSVRVKSEDCKVAGDKAMIRGELIVRVLYIADNEIAENAVMEFNIPVSQVVDAPGIENNARLDYRLQLMSGDVRLIESGSGDNGSCVAVDCRLCAFVAAYTDEETEYISDAYSTSFDLDGEYSQLQITRLADLCRESCVTKTGIDTETNGISKIIDIWGESCTAEPAFENGTGLIKGRLNACILALDNDSIPFYTERSVDYLCPLKLNIENADRTAIEASASVQSISYRLSGGSGIDLRCETAVEARVFETQQVRALSGACANEEHRRKAANDVALTLYYAQKGESVWQIARNYGTRCELIMKENEITDDEIDGGTMLLIPSI